MSEPIKLPEQPEARLTIERLPMGGYVVIRAQSEPGYYNQPLFAASTIDDAVVWIKHAMTDCAWPLRWAVE